MCIINTHLSEKCQSPSKLLVCEQLSGMLKSAASSVYLPCHGTVLHGFRNMGRLYIGGARQDGGCPR